MAKKNEVRVKKKGTYKKPPDSRKGRNETGAYSARATEAVNEAYLDMAIKLKYLKYGILAILVAFIIFALVKNTGELTVDNLGYMLRYIDIQGSGKKEKSEFNADIGDDAHAAFYKSNIVVLKNTKIDIYDMDGRRNFTKPLMYTSPVIETGKKYFLIYDIGSAKMEIFNSFSRVYEYKDTHAIYGAKVTDKGNVVYITRAPSYKSAVKVTDNNFDETYRCFFGEDFIVDADIDNSAENLAAIGFNAENGMYMSKVFIYDTAVDKCKREYNYSDEFPYNVNVNGNGFYAVFDKSIKFFDADGIKISEYRLGADSLLSAKFNGGRAVLLLHEKSAGSSFKFMVFDPEGKTLCAIPIGTSISDYKLSEDGKFIYFLTHDGMYVINIEAGTFELFSNEYNESADRIIYADEDCVYAAGNTCVNIIPVLYKED